MHRSKQKRKRDSAQRDLQTVYDTLAQPKLHSTVSCWDRENGKQNEKNQFKGQADIEVTCADPAARFCSIPYPAARRILHAAKVRLRATPSAQDDTQGAKNAKIS